MRILWNAICKYYLIAVIVGGRIKIVVREQLINFLNISGLSNIKIIFPSQSNYRVLYHSFTKNIVKDLLQKLYLWSTSLQTDCPMIPFLLDPFKLYFQ